MSWRWGAAVGDHPTYARYLWALQIPLTTAWERYSEGSNVHYRERALAYWIGQSESDEWAFDQLDTLRETMASRYESAPALDLWAREVADGQRKRPTRRGPKVKRSRDVRIATVVRLLSDNGMSERAVKRMLARALHKGEEGIESARGKGRAVLDK